MYTQGALLKKFGEYLSYRRDRYQETGIMPENMGNGMCFGFSQIQGIYKLEDREALFLEHIEMMLSFSAEKILEMDQESRSQIESVFDSYISALSMVHGRLNIYKGGYQKIDIYEKLSLVLPSSFSSYQEHHRLGATMKLKNWARFFELALQPGQMIVVMGHFIDGTDGRHAVSVVCDQKEGKKKYHLMDPNYFLKDDGKTLSSSARTAAKKLMRVFSEREDVGPDDVLSLDLFFLDGPNYRASESDPSPFEVLFSFDNLQEEVDLLGKNTAFMMTSSGSVEGIRRLISIEGGSDAFLKKHKENIKTALYQQGIDFLKEFQNPEEPDEAFVKKIGADGFVWGAILGNQLDKLAFAVEKGKAALSEAHFIKTVEFGKTVVFDKIMSLTDDMRMIFSPEKIMEMQTKLIKAAIKTGHYEMLSVLVDKYGFVCKGIQKVDITKHIKEDAPSELLEKLSKIGASLSSQAVIHLLNQKKYDTIRMFKQEGEPITIGIRTKTSLLKIIREAKDIEAKKSLFRLFKENIIAFPKSSKATMSFKNINDVFAFLSDYMETAEEREIEHLSKRCFIPSVQMLMNASHNPVEFENLWDLFYTFCSINEASTALEKKQKEIYIQDMEDTLIVFLLRNKHHELFEKITTRNPMALKRNEDKVKKIAKAMQDKEEGLSIKKSDLSPPKKR